MMRVGDLIRFEHVTPLLALKYFQLFRSQPALVLYVDVRGYETACDLLCTNGRVIKLYVSDIGYEVISTVEELG